MCVYASVLKEWHRNTLNFHEQHKQAKPAFWLLEYSLYLQTAVCGCVRACTCSQYQQCMVSCPLCRRPSRPSHLCWMVIAWPKGCWLAAHFSLYVIFSFDTSFILAMSSKQRQKKKGQVVLVTQHTHVRIHITVFVTLVTDAYISGTPMSRKAAFVPSKAVTNHCK